MQATVRPYGNTRKGQNWPSPYTIACGGLLALSVLKLVYQPLKWLAVAAAIAGLPPIILRALAAVRRFSLDINILMLIAGNCLTAAPEANAYCPSYLTRTVISFCYSAKWVGPLGSRTTGRPGQSSSSSPSPSGSSPEPATRSVSFFSVPLSLSLSLSIYLYMSVSLSLRCLHS